MNNAIKGALWSGLVFPGLGQIILKHYKRGAVIILIILGSMTVIVVKAVEQALTVLDKLKLEGGAISMSTITKAASDASTNFGSLISNLLLALIIGCWLISIIDAWILGRREDNRQHLPELTPLTGDENDEV
ncbi:MAG: hypothetical protein KKB30_07765 [Proteobacteria bacterium]|nr:hypothetical protein [Pseudomonadota bacterium]MBU1716013.1 hypothetical protein [Pseudomonadota bacterium]